MALPPSLSLPNSINTLVWSLWLQGCLQRSFSRFLGLSEGNAEIYFYNPMLWLCSEIHYINTTDHPVSETPAPDKDFEMALVRDHKHWRQAQHFRWFCLNVLMLPEQINAQTELLERRPKVRIVLPALLHNLVHLKETQANFCFELSWVS